MSWRSPLLLSGVAVTLGVLARFGLGLSWGVHIGFVVAVGMLIAESDRWRRFWFAPVSGIKIALWRVAVGAMLLLWAAALAPNIELFFGNRSFLPDPGYLSGQFGLMRWWSTPAAAWIIWASLMVAAALIVAGRLLRPATLIAWYCVLSLMQANPLVFNGGDDLLRVFVLMLMLYVWIAPRGSAAASLRPAISLPRSTMATVTNVPGWLTRLVQIQLTLIYPVSVIKKLSGLSWRVGSASLWALGLEEFERFPVPAFVRESLVIGALMTWSVLLLELCLAGLIWYRPTRKWGVIAGASMHVGFSWAMSLGFFTPIMLVGYLMFVDDETIERWFTRVAKPADQVMMRQANGYL